ncbi:type I phosphodiesterase / nucleotide pyrophosphatase [bacterium BMS3Abin15]|nr:type I phosphodiesterase / nucleotide pyrophosphatase [bacterium BMS3Abin15]
MSKTLLIGLDGASFDFLMPWIEEGKLPVFKKILQEGTHGILNSTIPSITCPALPTIYTGMNPGNLGIFSFLNPDGSVVSSSNIPYKSIWHFLSENNKKSLISNLRTTFPPEEINGVMICSLHSIAGKGLGSWENAESHWVYPKELQKELDGWAVDIDSFTENVINKILSGDPQGYQNVKQLEELRASKFKKLLLKADYDFAFHWIEHTDTMNHLCWGNKKLILKFYQEVIEPIMSDYLNTFKDWNILFISDHGAADQVLYDFNINTWLMNNGYLETTWLHKIKLISHILSFAKKHLPYKYIYSKYFNMKKELSTTTKEKAILPNEKNSILGVNWDNTIAYSDLNWGIRINRNKAGDNYEAIREKIISQLKESKSDSGWNIVQNAWKKEDIYSGKYLDQLPDIIVLPQNYIKMTKQIFHNELTQANKSKIGSHFSAINALFMAYGPDIAQHNIIERSNLYDILPTILFMLKQEIPKELDGKVLNKIFAEKSEYFNYQAKYTDETVVRTHQIRDLSDKEEEDMKKMLKSLGYFE